MKNLLLILIISIATNNIAQSWINIQVTKIDYLKYSSYTGIAIPEIYLHKIKHVNTNYFIDLKLKKIKVSFSNQPDIFFENVSIFELNNTYVINFVDVDRYGSTNKFFTSIYIDLQTNQLIYKEYNTTYRIVNKYKFIDFKISKK